MTTLTGTTARYAPWTAAELATLRETYANGGITAAIAALPHRSPAAIASKACRTGAPTRKAWTKAEDDQLRNLWGVELSLAAIARRVGRKVGSVYGRARTLGLRLGCPDGWEYLHHACERTGYEASQLRRILAAAGVEIHRAVTDTRRPKTPRRRGRRVRHVGSRPNHIVWPSDVDAAVEQWLEGEPLKAAARRLGVCDETLKSWLVESGIEKPTGHKKHWRVTSEQVEAAIEAHNHKEAA